MSAAINCLVKEEPSAKEALELQARKKLTQARAAALALTTKTLTLVRDPSFQTCTLSTAGGAVTFGAAGGAFGLASGVVVGAGVGVVPAIFTLGLSIPVGAIVGGGSGLCLGSAVGAGTGGVTGFGAYKYRVEIKDGLLFVKKKACSTSDCAKKGLLTIKAETGSAITVARKRAGDIVVRTKERTGQVAGAVQAKSAKAFQLATTTRTGVTATGVAAGGALGGTAGATVGTVAGAALGVIPALFTFGLSIPVGAAVGCCAGSVVGGGAGAVGGGAAAFGGFTYRKEISSGAGKMWTGASTAVLSARSKAGTKANAVKGTVTSFLGGSTGGSA